MRITWWDRFLVSVAPKWAMRRLHARAAVQSLARSYDATGGGRRSARWSRSPSDANAANGPHLASLRELSRDLRRNNGWARRGIEVIGVNTVGWGIQSTATGVSAKQAERARELWKWWSESPRCDFEGRMPFAGLQRLAMNAIVESGEVLVLRHLAGQRGPLPLQIQVVEPDLLDTSKDGFVSDSGGYALQGIEFDPDGRRAAYWLFPRHPGGMLAMGKGFQSRRVPAADVLHIYRVERPGQQRGVPWLCSAIARLHDLDEYDDAVLVQQKIAACFGAFVKDLDSVGAAKPLGQQGPAPDLDQLEPGMIKMLGPGQDVTFAQPPSVSDHTSFSSANLHRIAASLGVTYEDLTSDYSQVNFSSARMSRLAHYAHVHDWRWNMLIPQLCDGVWGWVFGDALALGLVRHIPEAEWSPPPVPMLEPDKEGLAYTRMIRSGVMTYDQAVRERGEDPDAQLRAIAAHNARLDALEIVLDSDPRKTSAAGQAQEKGDAADGDAPVTEPTPT